MQIIFLQKCVLLISVIVSGKTNNFHVSNKDMGHTGSWMVYTSRRNADCNKCVNENKPLPFLEYITIVNQTFNQRAQLQTYNQLLYCAETKHKYGLAHLIRGFLQYMFLSERRYVFTPHLGGSTGSLSNTEVQTVLSTIITNICIQVISHS